MKIYLEAGSGFKSGRDVNDHEIMASAECVETIQACADELRKEEEITNRGIQPIHVSDLLTIMDKITSDDLVVSVHLNFYGSSAGAGLRGYYRSTRWKNSERCKALSITVTKALHDQTDLYYHGVYNEQRDRHPQLDPIVKCRATACLVEVGIGEDYKDKIQGSAFHKNIGIGIARGIVRHLTSFH